jgi:hypothetical protein
MTNRFFSQIGYFSAQMKLVSFIKSQNGRLENEREEKYSEIRL